MKRKFYLFLSALLLMLSANTLALAEDYTDENGLQFTLNSDGTAQVKSQRNYAGSSLHIPAIITVNGKEYRVTSIANAAFQGASFSTVTFDESSNLTQISNWCFAQCNNVTEIEIPEGVTQLNSDRALSLMKNLEKVTLPSTLTVVGWYAFASDPALTTIIFKNSTPPTIYGNAFGETTVVSKIKIVIPNDADKTAYINALNSQNSGFNTDNVITQDEYDNLHPISYDNVTINGLVYNLRKVGDNPGTAVLTDGNKNCKIENVVVPATVTYEGNEFNVTEIANAAFQGGTFSKLEFESPSNITTIGDWVFAECNNVKEVIVPEGITDINTIDGGNANNRAFSKMNSLETIILPSTLKTLGNYALDSDPKLSTIVLNGSVPETGTYTFGNLSNITVVVKREYLSDYKKSNCLILK